jgi:Pyridoxamine 5'-phosphate oxidase
MTAINLPETKLDAGAVRALSELRAPKFLATRDVDGVPNVVPVLSLEAIDERTIVFGEMMIWKTRRNLEADARLSILVLSPDLRSWTVRGRFVEFQRSGSYFDHIASEESARYNPYGSYRSAGVIEVLGITRVSKSSQVGLLLATLRCRLLARGLPHDGTTSPVMPVQVREKFDRLKAAKALAIVDAGGHPDCFPGLPLVTAGRGRLVFRGAAARDLSGVAPGTAIAAAVLTMEPVAYQVKGTFAGRRRSLGQSLGVIDVREAYSACPPLPGQLLPTKA